MGSEDCSSVHTCVPLVVGRAAKLLCVFGLRVSRIHKAFSLAALKVMAELCLGIHGYSQALDIACFEIDTEEMHCKTRRYATRCLCTTGVREQRGLRLEVAKEIYKTMPKCKTK
jgi:hypothetical protein